MNIARLAGITAITIVVAGVLGYGGLVYYEKWQAEQKAARLAAADKQAVEDRRNARPLPDSDFGNLSVYKIRVPESAWETSRKAFYSELMAGADGVDVMVVPFQIQVYAFDRATRSLMAAQLAQAAQAAGKSVADPYLVARALGEGTRALDQDEVYRLANRLHVKQLVWGSIGYETIGKMILTVQSQVRAADGTLTKATPRNKETFENIAFGDDKPPIEGFIGVLPGVLKVAGIAVPAAPALKESRYDDKELPATPLGLTTGEGAAEPARDAWYFQLLAALVPPHSERARERLAEKSLLAVNAMAPASPDYRLLKARAYMLLGLRPAALAVLGTPARPEEKALQAALNGNLADLEQAAAQITAPTAKLIASLDANAMGAAYGARKPDQSAAQAEALELPGKIWPFLAMRAFTDWDYWTPYGNDSLKTLLDFELPVNGAATDLTMLQHVRKRSEQSATKVCCKMAAAARPGELDYLDLIEAIGSDNLVRRAHWLHHAQGKPDDAIEFIRGPASEFRDYPQLASELAAAELALIERAGNGNQVPPEAVAAFAHDGMVALYYDAAQTSGARTAYLALNDGGSPLFGKMPYPYGSEFPPRPETPRSTGRRRAGFTDEDALRYTTTDLAPVSRMLVLMPPTPEGKAQTQALLASLKGRFAGSAQLADQQAASTVAQGGPQASPEVAEQAYRNGIKTQPAVWEPYMGLAVVLHGSGRTKEAVEVLMSWPGFAPGSTENPVGIANNASHAGTIFQFGGYPEQAAQLLHIAAAQKTGAQSEFEAAYLLKLQAGDYYGAIPILMQSIQRYRGGFDIGVYLNLLDVLGYSKDSTTLFGVVAAHVDAPAFWNSALVGQQMAGYSEQQMLDWAKQQHVARPISTSDAHVSPLSTYMLMAGTIDRTPSDALADQAMEFDAKLYRVKNPDGSEKLIEPMPDGSTWPGLKPPFVRARSELAYFIAGYRLLRMGDAAGAKKLYEECARLYGYGIGRLSFTLPYFAYAAARSGEGAEFEKRLDALQTSGLEFYYIDAAKAVLAATAGRKEEALKRLQKIRAAIGPAQYDRLMPNVYRYTELCEWLFEATKDAAYRTLALERAKLNQQAFPWQAWAYAVEAKLATKPDERRRAIVMTLYLDPKSERLAAVPKAEVDAARGHANENPFLKKPAGLKREDIGLQPS